MYFGIKLSKNLFVRIFKKNIWIVLIGSLLIGSMCAYVRSLRTENQFSVSSEMVQNDNNYGLVASYNQFVQSRKFKRLVNSQIKKSAWRNKAKNLSYTLSIETDNDGSNNSPFFFLVVTSSNRAYAKFLTEQASAQLMANIGKYLSGANISVVLNASKTTVNRPITSIIKYFEYGFFTAFIILAIWRVYADLLIGKIKDESFVNDVFGLTKFGSLEIKNDGE